MDSRRRNGLLTDEAPERSPGQSAGAEPRVGDRKRDPGLSPGELRENLEVQAQKYFEVRSAVGHEVTARAVWLRSGSITPKSGVPSSSRRLNVAQ